MCSHIFLNVGMEMDSLLDPVIDSSHKSYFAAVEHRALEASHWSAHGQPRALPRGHVRRRGGREAHYGNYLDLASGTFVTNLILLFIVT